MSHYLPANTFIAPTITPHPALSLPAISVATSNAVTRFKSKLVVSKAFKADTPSLAQFVRSEYQRGWLADQDLQLLSNNEQQLALHMLSEKGASYVPERLTMQGAIDRTAIQKNLGGITLDAGGVQALGHAGITAGIFDNATLLGGLHSMPNLVSQFPQWFLEQANHYFAHNTAELLDLPLDAVVERHVQLDLEGHTEGAAMYLRNPYELTVYHLYLPFGMSNTAIMLRDTLCLLSDTLQHFELFHQEPGALYAGGGMAWDEARDIGNTLAGEPATVDSILAIIRKEVLGHYFAAGGAKEDIAGVIDDTQALLEDEDIADIACDLFPSLFGYGHFSNCFGVMDWVALVAEMLQEDHWTQRRFIPPHLRPQTSLNGESAESQKARWQAIAAYFAEQVSALDQQVGDSIPDTVAELKRIAGWLAQRASKGLLNVYLEDQETQEGMPFEMTFLVAADAGEGTDAPAAHLSISEVISIESIAEDDMQVGTSPRSALACLEGGFVEVEKLVEIAASYDTLGTALSRLSAAREKEKDQIK
jgi:hypothetical protein